MTADAGSDEETYCGAEYGEVRTGECECPRCAADAGSALDVAGIAAVVRKHLWSDPRSWKCVCGWKAGNGWEDAPAQSRVEQRLAHVAEAVAAHVEALREADRAAAIESAVADYERIDSTVPDVMAWFRARAARTEPTPMTAEQRAEVRLTLSEASELVGDDISYWLRNPFMDPAATESKVCYWLGILADRAAAEDHGLRARVEALITDPEWHIEVALGGALYVNDRLRAALDGGAAS